MASKTSHSTTTPILVKSGIGGAGNYRHSESIKSSTRSMKPAASKTTGPFTTGIGGAGNVTSRSNSPSTSSASSATSQYSATAQNPVSKLKKSAFESWHRRNERLSLYEAYNRKLPAYPGLFPSSTDKIGVYLAEDQINNNSTDTVDSRPLSLRQRVAWRVDRVLTLGLDEGLAASQGQKIVA